MEDQIKYSLMIGPMIQFIAQYGKVKKFNVPEYTGIKDLWMWLRDGVSWNAPERIN